MPVIITAEHVPLTMGTQMEIEALLEKLEQALPDPAIIRIFIKREHREFHVILTTHAWHTDLVYEERGSDLYALVRSAQAHTLRNLDARRKRWIDKRTEETDIGHFTQDETLFSSFPRVD